MSGSLHNIIKFKKLYMPIYILGFCTIFRPLSTSMFILGKDDAIFMIVQTHACTASKQLLILSSIFQNLGRSGLSNKLICLPSLGNEERCC